MIFPIIVGHHSTFLLTEIGLFSIGPYERPNLVEICVKPNCFSKFEQIKQIYKLTKKAKI